VKTKTVCSGEAAYMLRLELGPARHWEDMLTDMRRSRTSFHGLVLLPYCLVHDGRARRPYYRVTDVREFIEHAAAIELPPADKRNISQLTVEVDPSYEQYSSLWHSRLGQPIEAA
jgi:hypothetical protein